MNRTKLIGLIGFVTIVGVLVGVTIVKLSNPYPFDSIEVGEKAGDFTLPSVDGKDYTLSSDSGKVIVLTFMYTRCQMGCATISANMASVRNKLVDEGLMSQVKFVSINFDYNYSTMDDLIKYGKVYSNNTDQWQFVMGDESQTNKTMDVFDFPHFVDEGVNMTMTNEMNMTMNMGPSLSHAFLVYLIDQDGNLRNNPNIVGNEKWYLTGKEWKSDDLYLPVHYLLNE